MKIERISDNQIRCTLNKEDLEGKETLLSELAFGSEKAKGLFRELMNKVYWLDSSRELMKTFYLIFQICFQTLENPHFQQIQEMI